MYTDLRIKSTHYSYRVLRNLNFLYRFSDSTEVFKFHKNSFSGDRVVPFGQAEGQTD